MSCDFKLHINNGENQTHDLGIAGAMCHQEMQWNVQWSFKGFCFVYSRLGMSLLGSLRRFRVERWRWSKETAGKNNLSHSKNSSQASKCWQSVKDTPVLFPHTVHTHTHTTQLASALCSSTPDESLLQ